MDSLAPTAPGQEADPAALLGRADSLRDARDWIEAAIAYAAYLKVVPGDWPIWVQYGHCMKESGDVQAALLLYREAERLEPGDSDLNLQIGHALKLLGRVEEAYHAYARALTLDPANASARAELLATPGGQAPPLSAAAAPSPPVDAPQPWPAPAVEASQPWPASGLGATTPWPAPVAEGPPPWPAAVAEGPPPWPAADREGETPRPVQVAEGQTAPSAPAIEAPAPQAELAATPSPTGAAVLAPPSPPVPAVPAPPVPPVAPPTGSLPPASACTPAAGGPVAPVAAAPEPIPAVHARPEPAAALPEGALVFDASDLIDFFRHNRAPTGIQRVQLGILGAVLEQAPDAALAVFEPAAGAWKRLPGATLQALATLSRSGADPADPAWTGAMTAALTALLQAPPLAFPAGGALVNLGTSWWIPDYLRRVREAKAAAPGLRYVPFLHDCIPLVVPEHCAAGLVDEFARWFAGLCLHADLVLCNSACTEADFRRLSAALLPPEAPAVPTEVVRLDATTPLAEAEPGPPELQPRPLRAGRPYVLSVGTIESRKNHLMLFQAWLALLRRHGPEATPDLVCVGKRGWLAEAALSLHANAPALREKVQILHDVSDAALEALLRGCLFTVQASHYEGWGLPVTESLARGRVAVLPAHSGFLESGAGGGVFFTPGSEPALVEALERLILDPAHRAEAEGRLAGTVALRSWAEITAGLLAALAQAAPLPPPLQRLPPRTGAVYAPRLLPGPEPSAAMAVAEALREGPCWSVLEPWGCWTLPGTARLRLPVAPGTSGALRAHLLLLGPPPRGVRIGLRATIAGRPPAPFRMVEIGAGERLACSLDLAAEADAAVAIEIDCAEGVLLGGEGAARDLRRVGAGLVAAMACRPDDVAARLDWLETLALPRTVRL